MRHDRIKKGKKASGGGGGDGGSSNGGGTTAPTVPPQPPAAPPGWPQYPYPYPYPYNGQQQNGPGPQNPVPPVPPVPPVDPNHHHELKLFEYFGAQDALHWMMANTHTGEGAAVASPWANPRNWHPEAQNAIDAWNAAHPDPDHQIVPDQRLAPPFYTHHAGQDEHHGFRNDDVTGQDYIQLVKNWRAWAQPQGVPQYMTARVNNVDQSHDRPRWANATTQPDLYALQVRHYEMGIRSVILCATPSLLLP